jgi:hypothetical protein
MYNGHVYKLRKHYQENGEATELLFDPVFISQQRY